MKTNEQQLIEIMDGKAELTGDELDRIDQLLPGAMEAVAQDAQKLSKRLNDLWDASDYSFESDMHLGPIEDARRGLMVFICYAQAFLSHG